jgi:hypothetical protein
MFSAPSEYWLRAAAMSFHPLRFVLVAFFLLSLGTHIDRSVVLWYVNKCSFDYSIVKLTVICFLRLLSTGYEWRATSARPLRFVLVAFFMSSPGRFNI